jgi:hypothetical protein
MYHGNAYARHQKHVSALIHISNVHSSGTSVATVGHSSDTDDIHDCQFQPDDLLKYPAVTACSQLIVMTVLIDHNRATKHLCANSLTNITHRKGCGCTLLLLPV